MDRTFIMVKPDGVQRNLAGKIIARFEERGFKLVGLKLMRISQELAKKHYCEHDGKPFFEPLCNFITSSPVVAMVWEGPNAVQLARNMMGALKPEEATPGSIRGDFTISKAMNVIHGSDSPASAEREIGLFFKPEELLDYTKDADRWLEV
jgi:nucleoside-diphosphate kinase